MQDYDSTNKGFIQFCQNNNLDYLIEEWDYNRNQSLRIDSITYGSNKYVWWKCSSCGNEWQTKLANRTILRRGCSKCSRIVIAEKHRITSAKKNNLAYKYPEIAAE